MYLKKSFFNPTYHFRCITSCTAITYCNVSWHLERNIGETGPKKLSFLPKSAINWNLLFDVSMMPWRIHRDPHYFHYQVLCLVHHLSNKEQKIRQTHEQTPRTCNRKTEFFYPTASTPLFCHSTMECVRTLVILLVFLSCGLFISK